MILPLILFIVSGLVIVSLLVHSWKKISHGKGFAVLETLSGLDDKVSGVTAKTKDYVSLVNRHNTFKVLNEAFVFAVRVLLAIVEWIRNHIHTLYEKARHEKHKLSESGSSSVYLKQISEIKEEKKDL